MNIDNKEKKIISFLTNELNEYQKKAVTIEHGPILVIAGAGSGKTRVITARIIYLLFIKKVSPSSIVALTFTNKAAREMKDRIAHFYQIAENSMRITPFVGTFHGFCLMLLKQYYIRHNRPVFSILDEDDKNKIIRTIIAKHQLGRFTTVKNISHAIGAVHNGSNARARAQTLAALPPLVKDAVLAYNEYKKKSNCFDFDDLLIKTVETLHGDPSFARELRQRIKHLLIDEYQDTNPIQHQLLSLLSKDQNTHVIDSICAVGDDDQSIYSWRGADVSHILNFSRDFSDCTIIKIEQNYRSVTPILETANKLITYNSIRNSKNLWSEKKADKRIMVIQCMTDFNEASAAIAFIKAYKLKFNTRTIALLYRTHAQSRSIEEECIRASVPYQILGNIHFYARKEIKDLLAYLRLIVNPFDKISFFRILNTPARGLGEKCEETLYQLWENEPLLNCWDLLSLVLSNNFLPKRYAMPCTALKTLMTSLSSHSSVSSALQTIITKTDYLTFLRNEYDRDDALSRIENIHELLRSVTAKESTGTSFTIESFLDDVALMEEATNPIADDAKVVSIMTLHAAKGLEFDAVIIVGVEEGILPSARSTEKHADLEEERRLLYVGITRAREHLLISHTRSRYTYGQQTEQQRSRFIKEIMHDHILWHDFSYTSLGARDTILRNFAQEAVHQ